jgi:ribosome-associated protein
MDLRRTNGWTDFFVIATVNSGTHTQGLERHIKDFCRERRFDILRISPRPRGEQAASEDGWRIIDLGFAAVHLMTSKTRSFYELERLWSAGSIVFQEGPGD